MNNLTDIERRLDAIDDKILAALNERFALARAEVAARRANGLPPADPARERAIFEKALSATDPAERDTVYGVYEKIFGGARGVIESIARGVAIRDGKVLLCRAKGARTTYLPGGHIEFGESGRTALVREVHEELGVSATAGALLGAVENRFDQHGKRHCEINLVYRLDLATEADESQEDWITFEWCPLSDLSQANLLPAEMVSLVRAAAQ